VNSFNAIHVSIHLIVASWSRFPKIDRKLFCNQFDADLQNRMTQQTKFRIMAQQPRIRLVSIHWTLGPIPIITIIKQIGQQLKNFLHCKN